MDSLASQWWLGQPPRLGLPGRPPPRFLASGEVGGLQRMVRQNLGNIFARQVVSLIERFHRSWQGVYRHGSRARPGATRKEARSVPPTVGGSIRSHDFDKACEAY